jgi:hypothetical protein
MNGNYSINELLTIAINQNLSELRSTSVFIYDILDQAITKIIDDNKFWEEEVSLKNASYSSKGRCLKLNFAKENHKVISNYVDFARYGRYGKDDLIKLNKFLLVAKELAEFLEVSNLYFNLRVPTENRIINTASVESPKGFKSINLLHTDLILQKTDLLILTTTSNKKPSGLFFDKLKEQCNYEISDLRPFFSHTPEIYSSLLPGNELTGFKYLLILNLPKRDSNESLNNTNDLLNTLVLSSLAILEIQEKNISSISMPVLRGHYLKNKGEYSGLAKILLEMSAKWLKKSLDTKEINIGIYYSDEISQWNDAMNKALGRSSVNKDYLIEEISKELSVIIDKHLNSPLKDALVPLRVFLHQSEAIGIESIFIQGRKLVELLVSDLAKKHNIKIGGELMSNIEKFREIKMAPWLLSYMHTLRVFGNEGVHVRLDGKNYYPNSLTKSDLINGLTAMRSLLIFWDEQYA